MPSKIVIAIIFYSLSCLSRETAKGPFGLGVKLPRSVLKLAVMKHGEDDDAANRLH